MEQQPTHTEPKHATPPSNVLVSDSAPSSAEFAEAVKKGYEPTDLQLKAVFLFIAGLAVTLIVVLSVIYGIMMALAAHDRTGDPIASPVLVKLPPVYAPLQPSLGFYGNADQDHKALDADDMIAMRYRQQQILNAPAGTTASGRKTLPIDSAIDGVMAQLIVKPAVAAAVEPAYPPGSYEGHVGGTPTERREHWFNNMNSLNNQGN